MPTRLSLALCATLVTACTADPGAGDDDTGTGAAPTTAEPTTATDATVATPTTGDTATTGDAPAVPEFGATFTVIGTAEDGLDVPRDLEFNPGTPPGAPAQLWTYNMLLHGTVIFFDPGTPGQSAEVRVDAYGQHFMAYVSSAAFADNGNFASCQESRDEWNVGPQMPDDFMGPTLWSADLDIFAAVGQAFPPEGGLEGSHLDMLHQSPLCMGIAHDKGNVFWAFDGMHGNLVRYDFEHDHGPGGSDHSDGIITRYPDATVTRTPNVPGHLELDHATGMLYIADTGGGRIMRLDTNTGTNTGALSGDWDGADYTAVEGADFQIFSEGLGQPSGLALHDDRLFVSDHATGEVIAYTLDGTELGRLQTPAKRLMGITIGPAGNLWYADAGANQIVRVDP